MKCDLHLTDAQKAKLAEAHGNYVGCSIRINKKNFEGENNCCLELTATQKKKLDAKKGFDLKLSTTAIQKSGKMEGGFLLGLISKIANATIPHYKKQGVEFADNVLANFGVVKRGKVKNSPVVNKIADKVAEVSQKAIGNKLSGQGEGGFAFFPIIYGASKLVEKIRGEGVEGGDISGGLIDLLALAIANAIESKKHGSGLDVEGEGVAQEFADLATKKKLHPLAFAMTPQGERALKRLVNKGKKTSKVVSS